MREDSTLEGKRSLNSVKARDISVAVEAVWDAGEEPTAARVARRVMGDKSWKGLYARLKGSPDNAVYRELQVAYQRAYEALPPLIPNGLRECGMFLEYIEKRLDTSSAKLTQLRTQPKERKFRIEIIQLIEKISSCRKNIAVLHRWLSEKKKSNETEDVFDEILLESTAREIKVIAKKLDQIITSPDI